MTRMPAPAVAVAIAQFAPSVDSEANARQIDRMAGVAAERGAKLVVFPEYSSFFVDPFDEALARHAQSLDGPFVTALHQTAERTGAVIVAGLIETASNPAKVRNAVVAVGPSGVLAVYRKLHLYDAFGHRESDWVEAGEIAPPQLSRRVVQRHEEPVVDVAGLEVRPVSRRQVTQQRPVSGLWRHNRRHDRLIRESEPLRR